MVLAVRKATTENSSRNKSAKKETSAEKSQVSLTYKPEDKQIAD
jgi:hypothetical protein